MRLIAFSVFTVLSSWGCLIQEKQTSCCFGSSVFLWGANLRIDAPSLTPTPALGDVSREELWEKRRRVEVSKTRIRPTPGTFYFCFSFSHGCTQLGDLLNKTPLGGPGRKQALAADKQSMAKLSNVASRQQTTVAALALPACLWRRCDANDMFLMFWGRWNEGAFWWVSSAETPADSSALTAMTSILLG